MAPLGQAFGDREADAEVRDDDAVCGRSRSE